MWITVQRKRRDLKLQMILFLGDIHGREYIIYIILIYYRWGDGEVMIIMLVVMRIYLCTLIWS